MCLAFYGVFHKTWENEKYKLNWWINQSTQNFKRFINKRMCTTLFAGSLFYEGLSKRLNEQSKRCHAITKFSPTRMVIVKFKSKHLRVISLPPRLMTETGEWENFKVWNKGRNVKLLLVLGESDTTLTPSVRAKQPKAHLTAVPIRFINTRRYLQVILYNTGRFM